ncbi:hypothetical protein AN220_31805, partial [Streptomyces nanshensis]
MDDATGTVRTPVPGQRPERKQPVPEGETAESAAVADRSATAPETSGGGTDETFGAAAGREDSATGTGGEDSGTGSGTGPGAETRTASEPPGHGTDTASP